MSTPRIENRRYLLRLWLPILLLYALIGGVVAAALARSDRRGALPIVLGVIFVIAIFVGLLIWSQARRLRRTLQSADPNVYVRFVTASMRQVPHGSLFAATLSANMYALYGCFWEAEEAVGCASWQDGPPLMQAQEHVSRAMIAYARGESIEGIEHSIAASELASVDPQVPGARTGALALQTLKNLGLALSGRAVESTEQELGTALARSPLLVQINAAWGLAAIAAHKGDARRCQEMRSFIEARAPHFASVLQSIDSAALRSRT